MGMATAGSSRIHTWSGADCYSDGADAHLRGTVNSAKGQRNESARTSLSDKRGGLDYLKGQGPTHIDHALTAVHKVAHRVGRNVQCNPLQFAPRYAAAYAAATCLLAWPAYAQPVGHPFPRWSSYLRQAYPVGQDRRGESTAAR